MNEKRNTLGKIFSILMLLFFFAIILFMFFAIFRINEYTVFPAVMTFALINFVILLVIIGGGSEIANKVGTASYISICVVTAIYTLLQFIFMGFRYQSDSVNSYVFFQLILLFIYFLIFIPTMLMGANNNNK
jgi:hypothetical protein